MTSALLFVALLIVVDLSYRRWARRSIERRLKRARPSSPVIDLTDASIDESRPQRRSG